MVTLRTNSVRVVQQVALPVDLGVPRSAPKYVLEALPVRSSGNRTVDPTPLGKLSRDGFATRRIRFSRGGGKGGRKRAGGARQVWRRVDRGREVEAHPPNSARWNDSTATTASAATVAPPRSG